VLAEVAELELPVEQRPRLLRQHDLAPVAGRRDPGRVVHVESDVPLVRQRRLACVQPHPHPHGPGGKSLLRLSRCRDRVPGARKGNEDAVALRAHLGAAVALDGFPDLAMVLGESSRIAVAELGQQPGRTLDVGEQEGDGAGGKVAHLPSGGAHG
jgi:hypothetical protein